MGIKDEIARIILGGADKLALPAPKIAKEGIKVYHSSPHYFDKFSTEFAFKGEGAQAFGPGIYFSDSPRISGEKGHYWNNFSNNLNYEFTANLPDQFGLDAIIRDATFDGRRLDITKEQLEDIISKDSGYNLPKNLFNKYVDDAFDIIQDVKHEAGTTNIDKSDKINSLSDSKYYSSMINDTVESNLKYAQKFIREPYTYETLLHANTDNFIDQNKALRDQPSIWEKVKDIDSGVSRIDEEKLKEAFMNSSKASEGLNSYMLDRYLGIAEEKPGWGHDRIINTLLGEVNWLKRNNNLGSNEADITEAYNKLFELAPKFNTSYFQPYDKGSKLITQAYDSKDFIDLMKDREIPGTRYLAGGSRTPGKQNPAYNYTVWDPSIINIMKRYAIPGAIGAGSLLASDPSEAGESWSPDDAPVKMDKESSVQVEPNGELKSYNPTAQENTANFIREHTTLPIDKADDYVWLSEWFPPVAAAMEGYNAQKYRDEGDTTNAALSALFSALNAPTSAKAKALMNGVK
jgi:hypothetical protein